MSRRTSPSAGRPYGVRRVCRVWEIASATFYAWRKRRDTPVPQRRRGPQGNHSDEELLEMIRAILESSPFCGEGYRKVWARLRYQGVRTSKERIRRLMREHGLLAPTRVGRRRGPRNHDGKIGTAQPNQMWGTDLTTTSLATGQQVAVFIAIDHCDGYCVGIHAAERATRFEALEPIRQGVRENFGGLSRGCARGLALRHDHGTQYMSRDFQRELDFAGIESSPAFVRAPEGNGYAEWFIRILKENLLWVNNFESVEALRRALHDFRETYNSSWLMGVHGHKSPAQLRNERCPNLKSAA